MTTGRPTGPTIPLAQTPESALDVLMPEERSAVLAAVLTTHPDLVEDAEVAARELLTAATIEGVATDVSSVLGLIPLEDLGARAGRVQGRGYVHETDAAGELVRENVEPFFADMRRRASLGLMDAAAVVAAGIVAGLYRVRDPEGGTVLAYAGPDVPGELADDLMTEARRLGVVIADDVHDRLWPRWADLA